MEINISPLQINDYDQIREIDILTQQQYLGDKFNKMSVDRQEEHLVSRKSEFKTNVETGYSFVARENNKIIGFLLALETLPFRGSLFIRYIAIDPNYQGKGVGLLLYKKLIEKCKKKNIHNIQSLINLDNPKSLRLHEKLGFKISDRKEARLKIE